MPSRISQRSRAVIDVDRSRGPCSCEIRRIREFDGNPPSFRPLNQLRRRPAAFENLFVSFFSGNEGTRMQTTAERRWFWRETEAAPLRRWFLDGDVHKCKAVGGDVRTDAYLADVNQAELGIKLRGSGTGVEIKGLVSVLDNGCHDPPFEGPTELWTRWVSNVLTLTEAPLILVRKRRWLRKFDTVGVTALEVTRNVDPPRRGCTAEYTEISAAGSPMWVTLGFEAFGAIETLADGVRLAAGRMAERKPPAVGPGWRASYPVWLRQWDGATSDRKRA
jgi:hypothetical protein